MFSSLDMLAMESRMRELEEESSTLSRKLHRLEQENAELKRKLQSYEEEQHPAKFDPDVINTRSTGRQLQKFICLLYWLNLCYVYDIIQFSYS